MDSHCYLLLGIHVCEELVGQLLFQLSLLLSLLDEALLLLHSLAVLAVDKAEDSGGGKCISVDKCGKRVLA